MTQHLDGNQVTVQYFQHRDTKGKATIHVDVVTSSFRDVDSLNAGLCNIQAACANTQDACNPSCTPTNRLCSIWCTHIRQNPAEGQWADRVWFERQQRAATVMVSAAGSRFCSGSFIDNVNRAPLLLTAAHCGTGATTLIQQFWRSPICASIENFDGTFEQRGNIRVVAQRTESDVTLLEVGDPTLPANTFLSGWDATNDPTVIANVVAVHHPARSNMKLAHGGAVILSRWSGSGDPTHWRINAWTEATTEGGSSGSPMYHRQTRRIIGQLHGGSAACPALNGWDAYGGIFRSFLEPNFRQALTGGTTRLFMDGQFLRGFGNSTQ
jgi:V8-like Glu-specific endopeptidase